MDGIKKLKKLGIAAGIIITILGIVMLVNPVQVELVFNWVVGAMLLIGGIVRITDVVSRRKEITHLGPILIPGVAMLVLGIIVLVNEGASFLMMGMIISIFAFALAFDRFAVANERRKLKLAYGMTLILALFTYSLAYLWYTMPLP
ncbi:MAG: DUF308 domain-containing protein [Anaerovoracaceae bacterium]